MAEKPKLGPSTAAQKFEYLRRPMHAAPGAQTKPSSAYSTSPTHLPFGWRAVVSVVKSSQPHGFGPVTAVHVNPYWVLPASWDEKH